MESKTISADLIRRNPNNPRKSAIGVDGLAESIRAVGLMNPVVVRPVENGYYEVVAGSRRYEACRRIGMAKVPCTVLEVDEREALELATAENVVRENLTAVDEANAVARLFAQGKSRTEIGTMFGRSARWAEGRRKIVELGDRAMEYLASGRINLGHAEALAMCRPEDVDRWLNMATWKRPEELKKAIMNENPLLERAPFNAKRACKNCGKRSDCQRDLFGDVQNAHCLDRECFEGKVKAEAEKIRKKYVADGFEEVPEDDLDDAKNGWCGWVAADSDDEGAVETVRALEADGAKPKFWVDEETAEHGLCYYHDGEGDGSGAEGDERNEDPDSWEWQLDHMDYRRREKVRREASDEERRIVADRLKGVFGNIGKTAKAFILELLNRTFEDGDGKHESYLKHQYEAAANFIDEVTDETVNAYNGVNDDIREFLEMDSRETFERNANDALGDEGEDGDDAEERCRR